jgi:hypothetical protein
MKTKGKWANNEGNGAKKNKRAAILGLIAAMLMGGTAAHAGQTTTISEEVNTDVNGNHGAAYNTNTGDPNGNEVNIDEGAKVGNVRGAYSSAAEIKDNTVNVTGGQMSSVYGGMSYTVGTKLNGNAVNISGGQMGEVYGALGTNGATDNNTVHITGGQMGSIFGGSGVKGASNNSVYIENGEGGAVTGGKTYEGEFTGNSVVIENGSFSGAIMAAYAPSMSMDGKTYSWVNATDNHVTINGGAFAHYIYGACVLRGFASDNSVTITGGTIINHGKGGLYTGIVGAGVSQPESTAEGPDKVERNRVVISGADTKIDVTYTSGTASSSAVGTGSIIGGRANYIAGAAENEVSITGVNGTGSVKADYIYGAYAQADVSANRVVIGDSIVSGKIFGAETLSGSAYDNHVLISGGSTITGDICGAKGDSGDVFENDVILAAGSGKIKITGSVSGGQSANCAIRDNTVSLTGNTHITGSLKGGTSHVGSYPGYGPVANNQIISNGETTIDGTVYGGESYNYVSADKSSDTTGNKIIFQGDTGVGGSIYGGFAYYGNVSDNEIRIAGEGHVTGSTIGGYSYYNNATENRISISGEFESNASLFGGYATSGLAAKNSVSLEGKACLDGSIYGAYAALDAEENRISVDGQVKLGGSIVGAYAVGNAEANTVNLSGDADVAGSIMGARANTGSANNNTVTSTGSLNAGASVFGGYAPNGDAKENSVLIDGDSEFGASLYAGYAPDGEASGNSVFLSGGDINIVGSLWGGYSTVLSENNTLTVKQANITCAKFGGFQDMTFHVNRDADNGASYIHASESVDIDGARVNLVLFGDTNPIKEGFRVILIDAEDAEEGLIGEAANDKATAKLGATLEYEFDVYTEGNKLIASLEAEPEPDPEPEPEPIPEPDDTEDKEPADVPQPSVNPQAKALAEGWIAGMTQIIRAGDLVVDTIPSVAETMKISRYKKGAIPFAAVEGNRLRHKTGSHVDTRGLNVAAGIAGGKLLREGDGLISGAYFEYGKADFDTYNDFADRESVRGAGTVEYFGGGMFGKINFKSKTDAHTYLEGTLRGGRIKITYDSRNLKDALGNVAAFGGRTSYLAGHAAIGRTIPLTDGSVLDLKGGFHWARMNAADVKLTTGEAVNFEAVNSARVKLGGRLTGAAEKSVKAYGGFTLEREFSAKAEADVYGYKIDAPTLKGTTATAEAGFLINPGNRDRLTVEVGVKGHMGRRRGVTGGVKVAWKV